jgi:hypothetical protein
VIFFPNLFFDPGRIETLGTRVRERIGMARSPVFIRRRPANACYVPVIGIARSTFARKKSALVPIVCHGIDKMSCVSSFS